MNAKPFLCECGLPGVRRTSNREPICERCLRLEKRAPGAGGGSVKAFKFSGVAETTGRHGIPPNWERHEDPIAGASLEILNSMLAR